MRKLFAFGCVASCLAAVPARAQLGADFARAEAVLAERPSASMGAPPGVPAPDAALETLKRRIGAPAAAAHMGGLFGPAPNTLAAFETARAVGADIVEMDLNASADGVPIVFHDETLDAMTNCSGKVSDKTAAQLKACHYRNGRAAVLPTFEEVLDWSRGRVVVNAEFKDFAVIAPALALARRFDAYSWLYFQAQDSEEKYARARALDPRIALLFAPYTQPQLDWALGLNDDRLLVISIHEDMRRPETLAAVHAAGKLVSENAWLLGHAAEVFGASCDKAFAAGIDIAVSNRPAGCVAQRGPRK